jgi:hypothetical protein
MIPNDHTAILYLKTCLNSCTYVKNVLLTIPWYHIVFCCNDRRHCSGMLTSCTQHIHFKGSFWFMAFKATTTTYVISAYHHWWCEFESRSGCGVQHYVIKFVSDLRQVDGFLLVLRFLPPMKLTNEPHKRHEGRCGEHSDAPDRKG